LNDTDFIDSDERLVAAFAPGTVAYYFDTASCAVIIDGPPAVTLSPVLTGTPEWLKPPFYATCEAAKAHDMFEETHA